MNVSSLEMQASGRVLFSFLFGNAQYICPGVCLFTRTQRDVALPRRYTLYLSFIIYIAGEILRIVFQNTATNHPAPLHLSLLSAQHPFHPPPIRSIVPRTPGVARFVGRSSIVLSPFRGNLHDLPCTAIRLFLFSSFLFVWERATGYASEAC